MGAVNLDNTGTGAAVTLSSDGTALLLNGTPIGGGGGGSSTLTINNRTAAYTVVAGDLAKVINCTSGTFTVSLTAAATLGAGFNVTIWNTSTTATDVITIDPNGTETIDGRTTLILRRGEGMQIVCDGTNWQTGDKKTMRLYAENTSTAQGRPVASGDLSIAIGETATASGSPSLALGYNAVASAARGTAIGCNSGANGSQAVTGSGAMALGGSYASGTDSFAAAIANNTSSFGARATGAVALGGTSSATAVGAAAIGSSAVASGGYSFAQGLQSAASAAGAVAMGQVVHLAGPVANAEDSFSFGPGSTARLVRGKISFASGDLIASGTYQSGLQLGFLTLRFQTTTATPAVLVSNNTLSAATTTNQVFLPNNSAYAFTGTIVARQSAAQGSQSAAWKVEGLIRRDGTAASTVLISSTITAISNVPGWTLALSADTTNGCLAITATGAAGTSIRWVATIQTSEVTYA